MRFHRINRPLAVALAAGAVMAPAAGAQYQDLRSPDTRDAAGSPRPYQDLRSPDTRDMAEPPRFPQDMRSPDTRDAAAGRGIETAPVVEFVEVPQASGFDWGDAGLGAAAGIGVLLIGTGGALVTVRTRRRVVTGS